MSNDFDLPVIKVADTQKRVLSMDEYFEFVKFNLCNAFDEQAYQKWKKMLSVNEPFALD